MQKPVVTEQNLPLGEDVGPLAQGTARAALTAGTTQIVTRVLAVVLSIVTARALEPLQVGLLGLAVILVGVVSMIGYYPEMAAVTASEVKGDAKYAAAAVGIRFALTAVLIAVVIFALPFFGGYLTGREDESASLLELMRVLALVPILELAGSYPRVLLQRSLDLNVVAAVGLLQPVVFVGLAVALLWGGYGYLGVAWANVVGSTIATLFCWVALWYRNRFRWEGWPTSHVWRETVVGSARIFAGGFGGFLGERLDNLLVSGAIGPSAMSYYSMAWNGSRTSANVFGSAIGFVLIPTLSRIKHEPARVRRAIHESLRHSYLLLAPVCAVLFVSSPLLVTYVLGAKWLPLVPCLRMMCLTVLAIPLLHACNALLVAAGRAHLTGIST
ncbi:MAG: oligosaccharide flippase family protein, partial [Blastocatellia bacterium]